MKHENYVNSGNINIGANIGTPRITNHFTNFNQLLYTVVRKIKYEICMKWLVWSLQSLIFKTLSPPFNASCILCNKARSVPTIRCCSHLSLFVKMGCDGGTIPKRNELVRQKQKPKPKDKEAELYNLWRYCALSQEPLQEPIVACGLGHLYNKTSVIEELLTKNEGCKQNRHIKSLRDVREIKLIKNPEITNSSIERRNISLYICPITKLEMNGKHRFVFLWNCCCVFSEKTLKQIDNDGHCPSCSNAYKKEEIVVLNGNVADMERMKENMQSRRVAKGVKKRKLFIEQD